MKALTIVFLLFLSSILSSISLALHLPTGLKNADLDQVTQTLGYNTSEKFLSNPYPLGGYSGFELGLASEFIDTTDLSHLGSVPGDQTSFNYNRVSVGKGLFYNVDVFFNFVPFSNANEISEYGGLLKWSFYEAKFLPLTAAVLLHANTININDEFINETLGGDLMVGLNLKNFALYFGGGKLTSRSTFTQSILDLTDVGNAPANPSGSLDGNGFLVVKSSQTHSFIGVEVEFLPIFVAAQIDRYEAPVYSIKLGYRL